MALLAATCSKIGGQGGAEGAQAGAQQIQVQAGQIQLQAGQLQGQIVVDAAGGQALVPQQLELVPAQFTGNGWQIITAAPAMAKETSNQPVAVTVATTLANDSSPGGRKVKEAGLVGGGGWGGGAGALRSSPLPTLPRLLTPPPSLPGETGRRG